MCTRSLAGTTSWLKRTKQRKKLSYTSWLRNVLRTFKNKISIYFIRYGSVTGSSFKRGILTLSKKAYSLRVPYLLASDIDTSFRVLFGFFNIGFRKCVIKLNSQLHLMSGTTHFAWRAGHARCGSPEMCRPSRCLLRELGFFGRDERLGSVSGRRRLLGRWRRSAVLRALKNIKQIKILFIFIFLKIKSI